MSNFNLDFRPEDYFQNQENEDSAKGIGGGVPTAYKRVATKIFRIFLPLFYWSSVE